MHLVTSATTKKLIFTLFLGYVQDDELNMRLTPKQLHSFKKNKVRKSGWPKMSVAIEKKIEALSQKSCYEFI